MRRRSPLIGFTEAELGFVIAGVIAAAATLTKAESQPPEPELKDSVAVVAIDSAPPAATVVDTSIVKPGRRDELPYCTQFGLKASPIEPISILDSARYVVSGHTIGLKALKTRLAKAESESAARQCKYKLFFRVVGDLPHRSVRKAKAPFFANFYISDIE